jgi:mRNA degradation ribonuclease J1/J2
MVKNATTLTFYGGVNEIGGNKILLQDGDTRVFFDFGMSFAMKETVLFAAFSFAQERKKPPRTRNSPSDHGSLQV